MQREIALKIIHKTISDNSYTNLLMRKELNRLVKIQRPFVTNLVNGVLKNYDYLVYQTSGLYSKTSLDNRIILAMAAYEKFFMHEKDYVINNEYVNLAHDDYNKKFINAILHKLTDLKEPNDEYIKHSLPKWLYDLLSKQYDKDTFNKILINYSNNPITYYHINPNKCSFDDLSKFDIDILENNTFTSKNNLLDTDEFNNGYFYVQDLNATKLVQALDLKENDLFLDACSAPGSKLFNALEVVKPSNAYSNDINSKRLDLIKNKSLLLGYEGINHINQDASKLYFDFKFDKILLDVPCSGLGVISRRSDIKFHIKPNNLDELIVIQEQILENVSKYLKDNGLLVYSTCTLNKKENTKQINKFLVNHNDFILIKEETIINNVGDMFYYAVIKKVK